MNDKDMAFVDISDNKKPKDKFMIGIIISLIILVILGALVYFFGYGLLKPYIKV